MANIVYVATNLDGYVASVDGDIGWLHETPNPEQNDYDWAEFIDRIDAII